MIPGQGMLLAVQRSQLLALFCPADNDFSALHVAIVKCMHGLAILQHHIVGNVHNVVDGAHTHCPQTLPHPLGGGGNFHIPHHTGGVAGAQVGCRCFHMEQLRQRARSAAFYLGGVQTQFLTERCRCFPSQTDDGQAVGAVGGDFKFHNVVVHADHGFDVLAQGETFLVQNENAVFNTVGEFCLLCMEVCQGADALGFGVVCHQIPGMQVPAAGRNAHFGAAHIEFHIVNAVSHGFHVQHLAANDRAEHLVAGLNIRRNGGFLFIQRVIIIQQRSRNHGCVGEIPLVQTQLAQAAEHAVGHYAPQLALFDFLAAGQGGFVQRHREQIAGVNVPCTGDNLHRLFGTHVHLTNPHMIGIRVTFHGQQFAHNHVADFSAQIFRNFHFRAGQGHCLGKIPVTGINCYKFIQPFSAQVHSFPLLP